MAGFMAMFDQFRKLFGGKKRGNQTEFDNFVKKTKDWEQVLPLLFPAIKRQIASRDKKLAIREFVPYWKNLQTWINNRCWEEEEGSTVEEKPMIKADDFFNQKPIV